MNDQDKIDLVPIGLFSEPDIPFFWEVILITAADEKKFFNLKANNEFNLVTYHGNSNVERSILIKKLEAPLCRDNNQISQIHVKILKTFFILDKNGKDVSNSEQICSFRIRNGVMATSRGKYIDGLRDGVWSFMDDVDDIYFFGHLNKKNVNEEQKKIGQYLKKFYNSSNTIKYEKGIVSDQHFSFFLYPTFRWWISGAIKNNKMIGKWKYFGIGSYNYIKSPHSQIDFGHEGLNLFDSNDRCSKALNFSFQGFLDDSFIDLDFDFLADLSDFKIDEEWVAEWYEDLFGKVKYTSKNGLLEGSFEAYDVGGEMTCKCDFKDGVVDGEIQWFEDGQKGDLNEIYDARHSFPFYSGVNGFTCSYDKKDKNLSIIHGVNGYWSNYSDPLETLEVEFKFNGDRLKERTITQLEFWDVPSTELIKETFNKKGELIHTHVHEVLEKHNAYKGNTLIYGDFSYDDDDKIETLLCRTIELINDHKITELGHPAYGIESSIESKHKGSIFGFYNAWDAGMIIDKYYYSFGEKSGISMHFRPGCKNLTLEQLRAPNGEILWDNRTGINTKKLGLPKIFKLDP